MALPLPSNFSTLCNEVQINILDRLDNERLGTIEQAIPQYWAPIRNMFAARRQRDSAISNVQAVLRRLAPGQAVDLQGVHSHKFRYMRGFRHHINTLGSDLHAIGDNFNIDGRTYEEIQGCIQAFEDHYRRNIHNIRIPRI